MKLPVVIGYWGIGWTVRGAKVGIFPPTTARAKFQRPSRQLRFFRQQPGFKENLFRGQPTSDFGLNALPSSQPPKRVRHSFSAVRSHSLTTESPPPPPVASVLPSGEKASDSILPRKPVSVRINFPVCASQNFTVLSLHPLAIVFPSGENVTESTSAACPSSAILNSPVSPSQSRIVVS